MGVTTKKSEAPELNDLTQRRGSAPENFFSKVSLIAIITKEEEASGREGSLIMIVNQQSHT